LQGIPTEQQAPEDLADYFGITSESTSLGKGHGTGVASVAAGLTLGVASGAELMLIKLLNGRQLPDSPTFPDGSPKFALAPAKPSAIIWAWRLAMSDALQNNKANPFMRAVINFSFGTFPPPPIVMVAHPTMSYGYHHLDKESHQRMDQGLESAIKYVRAKGDSHSHPRWQLRFWQF
jgi:hypothetical protein